MSTIHLGVALRKIVPVIGLAFCCALGVAAPAASADAWTDGQVQWASCKQAGHPDEYCRTLLNKQPLPAAPAPNAPAR